MYALTVLVLDERGRAVEVAIGAQSPARHGGAAMGIPGSVDDGRLFITDSCANVGAAWRPGTGQSGRVGKTLQRLQVG